MKIYPLLCCFFFLCAAHAQVSDNFSDGNFTSNPLWSGSVSDFAVTTSLQLQLNAAAAGTSWLSTPYTIKSLENLHWQTSVRQSFSPSASNYGRIYLVSDEENLTLPLHGYYLQFGESGSKDAIELFRQDGATSVSVCRGEEGAIAASFSISTEVIYQSGKWQVAVDRTGGKNFIVDSSGTDSTYSSGSFIGIACVYTASNASKFYYDDFYAGPLQADTIPSSADDSAQAVPKDIIISEIFADPSPSVGLPDAEYAELFNRSSVAYQLNQWQLSDGNSSALLPSFLIAPGAYVLLTSLANSKLFDGASVLGLDNFPSLNNSDDHLILKNADALTVDSVYYSTAWYRSSEKSAGGWSLELIDPSNTCGEEDNWTASEAQRGGTPGTQNSVYASKPDVTGPKLLSLIANSKKLILNFDEKLQRKMNATSQFTITPAININQATFTSLALRQIQLDLADELQAGQLYTIEITAISDCNGNILQNDFSHLSFALTQDADSLDIVINEVLFNPRPLGVDFTEVYNRSSKFINLKNWKLANVEDGVIKNAAIITESDFTLAPGSFLCFTSDGTALKSNYPQGKEDDFFICRVPSLSDDEGSVALVDDKGLIIDYFFYSKDFHSPLVQDDEGVSLERVSFYAPSNDRQNWKSASSQSGFATPGYANSDAMKTAPLNREVVVTPVAFAPGSGAADFAMIRYRFDVPGLVANLKVTDQQGRLVKTIGNNETLSAEGFFRWDGDRDDGGKVRMGYYVIWLEIFDLSGSVRTYRKRVIIASR